MADNSPDNGAPDEPVDDAPADPDVLDIEEGGAATTGAAPPDGDEYDAGSLGAVPAEEEGPPVDRPELGEDHAGPKPEPDPLEQAQAERDELRDQLLRARADYDNLNKRRHKEVAAARGRGAAAVMEGLLEVLDNFGFALQAAARSEDAQLAKGVQLVHDQLLEALEKAGLSEVDGVGSVFDPAHHEALMSEADGEDRPQPEVAEVLRVGYRYHDQLLRPASVKVVE
ncbi:nucleotide exchange factor GrpE [Euzebya tangerina]|uniref:nucleotide exchange factor GrpE n=1 Tax=Euzebya tangerina TaxID=591198 RepID=UPI000E3136C3|nr:nucleotide exchange factor GrpE [Euzebya tangerina]